MRKNLFGRARLFLTHLTVVASLAPLEGLATADLMNLALYESVLRDDSLPRIPKDVLRYIIFRSDESNTCFFGQAKACKQLKYGRTQFSEAVAWLRRNGYISTSAKGKILTYDLSPYMTRQPDLSPNMTYVSPPATGCCRSQRHRTKHLNYANERTDKNGLRYRITAEGSRQYL